MARRNKQRLNTAPPSTRKKSSATASTTASTTSSSKKTFLDLPAEIRNEIYKLALLDYNLYFSAASSSKRYRPTHVGRAKAPGLPLACKHVQDESINMLYSKTSFRFDCPGTMVNWLRKIGAKKRGLLQEVIVNKIAYSTAYDPLDRQAHDMLTGLERTLKDVGIGLPMQVYKVMMRGYHGNADRHDDPHDVLVFSRWQNQEMMYGQWVTVKHMEEIAANRE